MYYILCTHNKPTNRPTDRLLCTHNKSYCLTHVCAYAHVHTYVCTRTRAYMRTCVHTGRQAGRLPAQIYLTD